jgi:hypothetical protein
VARAGDPPAQREHEEAAEQVAEHDGRRNRTARPAAEHGEEDREHKQREGVLTLALQVTAADPRLSPTRAMTSSSATDAAMRCAARAASTASLSMPCRSAAALDRRTKALSVVTARMMAAHNSAVPRTAAARRSVATEFGKHPVGERGRPAVP